MGKKDKRDKKGKGKEKTALKTERNAEKRAKKELVKKGEDDIEKLIQEFQQKDKKRTEVIEEKCPPPSERSNMTLTAHPDKEELIMFGGEYYTGNKMYMYNDLLFYNIKKNEWTKVTAPNAPPPRSSHQAVAMRQGGGQLWIFGGEFASPTQSQFYHYKELWLYHIKDKQWQKITAPGGPSSRSGHRMVQCKKLLIVFGGFHDNVRDYKYFNDVYAFNVESFTWSKIEVGGMPPSPRSGCVMAGLQDQYKVVVYGGYSKTRLKRDVDKGTTNVDMFALVPDGKHKDDTEPEKWKWTQVKQSGYRPGPRCGMSSAVAIGNKAVCFGGVFDTEEDDEQLSGQFYNEMYLLDLEKGKWFTAKLRGKKTLTERKKRRKKKDGEELMGDENDDEDDVEDENMEEEMEVAEEDIKNLNIDEGGGDGKMPDSNGVESLEGATAIDDGVFQIKVGPQGQGGGDGDTIEEDIDGDMEIDLFVPKPRMGAHLAVKSNVLFMYGGMWESGDKQYTFSDFYALDLGKMEEWNVIIENDDKKMVWEGSDSSDDEEMEAAGGKEEDDDDESDEDIDDLLEGCDVPVRNQEEEVKEYFERTKEFWVEQSKKYFKSENMDVSNRTIHKFAKEMCQEYSDR